VESAKPPSRARQGLQSSTEGAKPSSRTRRVLSPPVEHGVQSSTKGAPARRKPGPPVQHGGCWSLQSSTEDARTPVELVAPARRGRVGLDVAWCVAVSTFPSGERECPPWLRPECGACSSRKVMMVRSFVWASGGVEEAPPHPRLRELSTEIRSQGFMSLGLLFSYDAFHVLWPGELQGP